MTDLHQCPCCPSTKCKMDEPCLGCETYAEWVRESKKVWYTIDDDGKKHFEAKRKEEENDFFWEAIMKKKQGCLP